MKMILRAAVFLVLTAALIYGKSETEHDLSVHVRTIFPESSSITKNGDIFQIYSSDNILIGWASAGRAVGYGGPMTVVTGIDTAGCFIGASIVEHKETPVFFRMLKPDNYFAEIKSLQIDDVNFKYNDVVGVTGATRSADAISKSLRSAMITIAGEKLDIVIPVEGHQIQFGILELTILILFIAGILSQYLQNKKASERIRWVCQLTGLAVIGFWENSPINISKISAFLSGYLPYHHSNIHWYLLIAGFLLTILIYNKSIYCSHLCPFGTVQRCVGVIGGGKISLPSWAIRTMIYIRNGVVFLALFIAFASADPGNISYEPFAAVFSLKGSTLQWVLLLVVLTGSLMIKNPWCHFFCPMRTCEKVIQEIRKPVARLFKAGKNE